MGRDLPAQGERPRRIHTASLAVVVLAGAALRVAYAGDEVPFGDELHALHRATVWSFGRILTSYSGTDYCQPFALYLKVLRDTLGWNEWLLRGPGIAAGILLVALAARVGARRLRATESLLVTGAMALSPQLVFHARQARPYAIAMLLVALAALGVFAWRRRGERRLLLAAAACGASALHFHLACAPTLAALALYTGLRFRGGRTRGARRDRVQAAALFAALAALFLGPSLPSIARQIVEKTASGAATLATLRHALRLLHGLPLDLPLPVWLLLTAAGAAALWRRYPEQTACGLLAIAVQLAALYALQPLRLESSAVLLRYLSPVLPFLLALLGCALAWPLERLPGRAWKSGAAVALLATFGAYHLAAYHYGARARVVVDADSSLQRLPLLPRRHPPARSPSHFYETLATSLAPGALIECPYDLFLPTYAFYQLAHGRRVYEGVLDPGLAQILFPQGVPLRFHSLVDLTRSGSVRPPDARYLVVHEQLYEESWRALRDFRARSLYPETPGGVPRTAPEPMRRSYDVASNPLPESVRDGAPVVYRDEWLTVYDLREAPGPDPPRRPGAPAAR
jgi:hypothetical protein